MDGFVRFTRTTRRPPRVVVSKDGVIRFNRASVEDYKLGDYSHAVLFFDKETSRIGVEFVNSDVAEGSKRATVGRHGSINLSSRLFFQYFGLNIVETQQYRISKEDDMFIIDLKAGE